jgi:hypothetical protein
VRGNENKVRGKGKWTVVQCVGSEMNSVKLWERKRSKRLQREPFRGGNE